MPTPIFTLAADEPPVKPHSIYTDLLNLPDPVYLGITPVIYNYDSVGLYMRFDGYKAGWTFSSVDFGLVGAGGTAQANLDNFAYRAKPAAETEETITLRLRAYTDAGYTDLKWTYERIVTVVIIKSDDGSWTQDVLNNFDDGTVQGWAIVKEEGASEWGIFAGTVWVVSPAYALHGWWRKTLSFIRCRLRFWKAFNTANRNRVFAIMEIRQDWAAGAGYHKNVQIKNGEDVLCYLGRPFDGASVNYVPVHKWMRICIPLPKNTAVEVRYVVEGYYGNSETNYMVMDDFKIISKD